MKTVTGRVISAEPISLSKAATLLYGFASSDNGASQDVSAYLRRASAAFTELKSIHREIKSKETKPRSDARRERDPTGESDGGKLRYQKSESESVSEKDSIGREQEIKKKKSKKIVEEDVVDGNVNENLESEQRSEERNKEKKKKKRNKEENVDGKVNENLEDEQRSEERKERKKEKMKKRNQEEVVVDEKKKKKKKKKRKSDEEMGSEERKNKKRRKSKEIDG